MKVAIVVARWNEFITKPLLDGAIGEVEGAGAAATVVWVPGSWEIPVVAQKLALSSDPPDAIVALGCILQGETGHAAQLASNVSNALMQIQLQTGVPIAWGVLTPDTPEQAVERTTDLKQGHRGREAARAALDVAEALNRIP